MGRLGEARAHPKIGSAHPSAHPKKIGLPPQPNFVQRPAQEKMVCKRPSFEKVKKDHLSRRNIPRFENKMTCPGEEGPQKTEFQKKILKKSSIQEKHL